MQGLENEPERVRRALPEVLQPAAEETACHASNMAFPCLPPPSPPRGEKSGANLRGGMPGRRLLSSAPYSGNRIGGADCKTDETNC